jgi:ABC-type Mn2+/Zn2+ transport system ATPase subunit
VTTFPLAGIGFLADERIETVFLSMSVLLAGASLTWGFRIHRQQGVLFTLGSAAILILTGRFFLAGLYEIVLVATGVGLLAAGHLLNLRLCRTCLLCQEINSMSHAHTVLRTSELALGYGDRTVLAGVNLEVRAGEFWFFLGQNGGGKTTLLKAILGLISPRAGHLWLHPQLGSRTATGFVPQHCALNPTLPTTVREFVLLGLVGVQVTRAERAERLRWALEKMGLAGMAEHDYWSLSGGQRQRALVARALVRRPTLLVLDEPTSNLDLSTEDALLRLLVALNTEQQQTLLFVTHNVAIAARYATHVALLHAGKVWVGPRQLILTPDNLARIYGIERETPLDPFALPTSASLIKPAVETQSA